MRFTGNAGAPIFPATPLAPARLRRRGVLVKQGAGAREALDLGQEFRRYE